MKRSVIIIGSGIRGLGSAALLAKAGYEITVIEKNQTLGGRANIFKADGYTFDMGPSWYLMPDVFEHYFKLLDEDINDHLDLVKLSPSYRVFFSNDKELPVVDIHSDLEKDLPLFEQLEPGVTPKIKEYLRRSGEQYEMAKDTFMYRNLGFSIDFLKWKVIKKGILQHHLFTLVRSQAGKHVAPTSCVFHARARWPTATTGWRPGIWTPGARTTRPFGSR